MKRSFGCRRALARAVFVAGLVTAATGMDDARAGGLRIEIGIGGPVPRHLPYGARHGFDRPDRHHHFHHRHFRYRKHPRPGGLRLPGGGYRESVPRRYRGGFVYPGPPPSGAPGRHRVLRPWGPLPYRIRSGCYNVFKVILDGHGRRARIGGLLCYDASGRAFIAPGSRYLIGYE